MRERSRGIGNSFEEEKQVLDTLHGIVLFLRLVQPSPTSNSSSFFLSCSFFFFFLLVNLRIDLILRRNARFIIYKLYVIFVASQLDLTSLIFLVFPTNLSNDYIRYSFMQVTLI